MDILTKMNEKMDQGYKVTNIYCSFCNGVTMCKQGNAEVYCPKCNKQYLPEKDSNEEEIDPVEENYEKIIEQYNRKKDQNTKTQDVSKKIGEKLIQGWTMLEESCLDCNVPLMRSKKGMKLCCGCEKNFAEKNQKINQKMEETQKKEKKMPVKEKKVKKNERVELRERVESMLQKSAQFLEGRLQKAIQYNDLDGVERIVELVSKIEKMI